MFHLSVLTVGILGTSELQAEPRQNIGVVSSENFGGATALWTSRDYGELLLAKIDPMSRPCLPKCRGYEQFLKVCAWSM